MGVLENLPAFAFHVIEMVKLAWVSYTVFSLLEMQNIILSLLCMHLILLG